VFAQKDDKPGLERPASSCQQKSRIEMQLKTIKTKTCDEKLSKKTLSCF
jgi:hypothetical protein